MEAEKDHAAITRMVYGDARVSLHREPDARYDALVIDGLNISKWSRSVFEARAKGGVDAANCTCSIWERFHFPVRMPLSRF